MNRISRLIARSRFRKGRVGASTLRSTATEDGLRRPDAAARRRYQRRIYPEMTSGNRSTTLATCSASESAKVGGGR
jgi:hypothetical protein